MDVVEDGASAWVRIVDDGLGVDPEEAQRIFEPGVRGKAGEAAGPGAGLGLSLARRLATSAGGEITADPTRAGGAFTLRLPLASQPRQA